MSRLDRVARFRFKTDLALGQYAKIATGLIFGPRLAQVYGSYLLTLHQIIRASVPLMQVAADEAARRFAAGDGTCRGLAEYYLQHKEEETRHVEWLLEDIEVMGGRVKKCCANCRRPRWRRWWGASITGFVTITRPSCWRIL